MDKRCLLYDFCILKKVKGGHFVVVKSYFTDFGRLFIVVRYHFLVARWLFYDFRILKKVVEGHFVVVK